MTAPRLTEEHLVALERGPHGIVFVDLVADIRAARAERDALRARLEGAREALRVVRASLDSAGVSVHGMSALEWSLRAALEGETT